MTNRRPLNLKYCILHFCSDDSHSSPLQTAVHRLALTVELLPVEVCGLPLLVCQAFAHHRLVWEIQLVLLETEYTFHDKCYMPLAEI